MIDRFDAEKVKTEIVQWIRDWFDKNGKDSPAVIGISGGKDSSVVAALCVEALGNKRVYGVMMPNGIQPDIDMSRLLIAHLQIPYYLIDIEQPVKDILYKLAPQARENPVVTTNLPPRIRMSCLYAYSQSINGRVANTCNLSENYLGWSTRWGDETGDFAPIANLTCTEVKELGRALKLPDALVNKVPSDGLCGKTDEEKFGFSYDVLDGYIRTGIISDNVVKDKIDEMHIRNQFKMEPIASFHYEGRRPYACGFLVGRFQPIHNGHKRMIDTALKACDKVLIMVGSSQESRTEKNPFTYEERYRMIRSVYPMDDRIEIIPIPDKGVGNNKQWGEFVIQEAKKYGWTENDVFISGEEVRRDNWFGDDVNKIIIAKNDDITATKVRAALSEHRYPDFVAMVPNQIGLMITQLINKMKEITTDKTESV